MPSDPPQTGGGPNDDTPPSTTSRLQQMVVNDALLADFERTRWPHRVSSDLALAVAAPLTWILAGNLPVAAVTTIIIISFLLVSAWKSLRGERRDAQVFLGLSRWTIVASVVFACMAFPHPTSAKQPSPGPAKPVVRPATHLGGTADRP